jgi:hypothetical protein
MWVGLDGDSRFSSELLQIGIEADYYQNYTPWIEYWPNNVVVINNVNVRWQDQLFLEVFAGVPGTCAPSNAAIVWACGDIENFNTNQSSGPWAAVQPSGTSFNGVTADFLVERKGSNPLTNFNQVWINGEAEDINGNWHYLATDFYQADRLINSSGQLLAYMQDSNGRDLEVVTWTQSQ